MIVVDIGYRKIILPKEQAMLLVECLEASETYEEKYWSDSERKERGMDGSYTYHVYTNDNGYKMHIVSDELYAMAKLAGKPQEK